MTKLRIMFAALVLVLIFSACGGRATLEPTNTPEPTKTTEPTVMSVATDTPAPIKTGFTPYSNNPVLVPGAPGSWDDEAVFGTYVMFKDGLYHMLYNGSASPEIKPVAIGYATSPDGRSFTRHAPNPILAGDETGFDAIQVSDGVLLLETDTWMLYYNAGVGPGPGKTIGRATAPDPGGPWERGMHWVLLVGSSSEWDSGFVVPENVIATDKGYAMYYIGGTDQMDEPAMIGLATSPDGVTWTKYNDPDTTEPPFAESDPVLQPGSPDNWDSGSIWGCSALKTASGWEMFYSGSSTRGVQIGYAASADGIHWTKYTGNPILAPEADRVAIEKESFVLEAPSIIVNDPTYLLFYDYGFPRGSIGMAIGMPPK